MDQELIDAIGALANAITHASDTVANAQTQASKKIFKGLIAVANGTPYETGEY